MTTATEPQRQRLAVILGAAIIQGLALYGLHLSVQNRHWPASDPAWLLALYAVAVFAPVTAQLLAEHMRARIVWWLGTVLIGAFFYFGWHYGANLIGTQLPLNWQEQAFLMTVLLGLLWLLALPFVQCRLLEGKWQPNYRTLFAVAWRNKLTLAEAGVFTGLFWLLLLLWGQLFKMLDIGLFATLFRKPWFIYPVTASAFGFALYMIGSLSRLVTVVLEQVLNVLKWLAVIAGLILALFTVALLGKVPDLLATGARTIGAAWLLWLVAVMVLLINAAYRDGSEVTPYPRWIALSLRGVLPLLSIIVLCAGYAIYLRIAAHGVTVERFWACVVVAAAGIYAAGYAYVAVRRHAWMVGIEHINIAAALFLIAVIGLALTPVLSPQRIAAASQFERAKAAWLPTAELGSRRSAAMQYLAFDSGTYGRARLAELAQLQDHPRAAEIREAASHVLESPNRWAANRFDATAFFANLTVHPAGRPLDSQLQTAVASDLSTSGRGQALGLDDSVAGGVFVDLNGNGVDEFVLLTAYDGWLYARRDDASWYQVGRMQILNRCCDAVQIMDAVKAGEIKVQASPWGDLRVGASKLRLQDAD